MANIGITYSTQLENEVVKLYEVDGLSIAKIVAETGVRERRVKQLIKGKVKGKTTPVVTTNINSKVDKVVLLAYGEAVSDRGLTDYRLRTLAHTVYGTTWNPAKGKYKSNIVRVDISRIKQKLRTMASANGDVVKLLPSWMNPKSAKASTWAMEAAAVRMLERFHEEMHDYMERFAIKVDDSDESDRLLTDQWNSGLRHLMKVTTGLGNEPVSKLMERTMTISDEIDSTEDLPLPHIPKEAVRQLVPEPKQECYDAFFDEIEQMELALGLAA